MIGLVGGVLMTSSVIGQILGINEKISSVVSRSRSSRSFSGSCRSACGMTFKGFRKDQAPLMVEAAAEDAELVGPGSAHCLHDPSWRRWQAPA